MPICDRFFPRRQGEPVDAVGCFRREGHTGGHLFKCSKGKYYEWDWDFCGCEGCMSDDYMDQCCVYSEVSEPNPTDQTPPSGGRLHPVVGQCLNEDVNNAH